MKQAKTQNIKLDQGNNILNDQEKALIKSLLYYDIFDHPLTANELAQALPQAYKNSLDDTLTKFCKHKLICNHKGYYCLKGKEWTIKLRQEEQKRVKDFIKKAQFMARIVASTPFVRAAMISGSLSKMRMGNQDDIDFFIITKPGRLWISRTLLVIFKRLFLLNSYKLLCLNYFIDSDSLEIKKRTRYNAIEIMTLIPVYNEALYQKLMESNDWIKKIYPGFNIRDNRYVISEKFRPFKAFIEFILNTKAGNKIDDLFMKITYKHRKKKFNKLTDIQFKDAFISQKNISTHHPDSYHFSVMEQFNKKIELFEKENHLVLGKEKI